MPEDHVVMDEQHKRSKRFDTKIAFWNLDGKQKENIAKEIIDGLDIQLEYRSQMMLSIIIATLGLLVNATPVVIGAMIIAPILRPISGVAFWSSTGNKNIFINALRILLISTILGIGTARLLTILLPLAEVTNEIAIRTQPTLIDLWIAFASGLVAFLALWWKKMAAGLAGVAMAASLIPPLAVVWIGIWFQSVDIARGSLLLFLTNIVAIILWGILIFYLFGFHPTQKKDLKRSVRNSISAVIMMLILCIPLASWLINITKNVQIKNNITTITKEFFAAIDPKIELENMTYTKQDGQHNISLSIKSPQDLLNQLTEHQQTALTNQLAQWLENDVIVDMSIIPVTSVTKEESKESTPKERVQMTSESFLSSLYHDKVYLLNLAYHGNTKAIVVVTFYTDDPSINTASFSTEYKNYIREQHNELDKIIINREKTDNEAIPLTPYQQRIRELEHSFTSFFPETILHNIDLRELSNVDSIVIHVSTPLAQDIFARNIESRKWHLQELYDKEIVINSFASRLKEVRYTQEEILPIATGAITATWENEQ